MLLVDRFQQIITLVLVVGSAWLLSMAQDDFQLGAMAVTCALIAFIVNDWLNWIRFNRWVANGAAIAVTAFTLRDFFDSDSATQLLMIANLLVYLQIVLLFQRKTPRVYWQVLVLSLLQVVVAAAFNISLEGGVVFFAYLLFSAIMMVVLQIHTQTTTIRNANRRTADSIQQIKDKRNQPNAPKILAMHDQLSPDQRPLVGMIREVVGLGIVAIGFASVAFFFMPRDQQTWSGAPLIRHHVPGTSRSVNLEERSEIYLSEQLTFTAQFVDSRTGGLVSLPEEPYFYGMPLPNLTIQREQTRWEAPYDRVYSGHLTPPRPNSRGRFVIQSIKLEPTNDPLLYTMQPFYPLASTSSEIEWSSLLGLLARSNEIWTMGGAEYEYDLRVRVHDGNVPLIAVPYTGINAPINLSLEENPGEFNWLTYLPRERYPGLIQVAQSISNSLSESERNNHWALANALTRYLAEDGGFGYTLDFRQFDWDPRLDHIEDFVVNKKLGHCEFFASALTLMLRSSGIPARLVVGYKGGEYNGLNQTYFVREKDAHAWVEAYIRPGDCPKSWFTTGEASRLGAWLRLDPTPISDDDSASNAALSAVQNFWNSYIVGLDSQKQNNSLIGSLISNPFRGWEQYFTQEFWKFQWRLLWHPTTWYTSVFFRLFLIGLTIMGLLYFHRRWQRRRQQENAGKKSAPPFLQQLLGRAIAFVAPRLGRWVAGEKAPPTIEVPFYTRLKRILASQQLVRKPHETAMEFGNLAAGELANHEKAIDIQRHIETIINYFYRVRFSADKKLSETELQSVQTSLEFLESTLAAAVPR